MLNTLFQRLYNRVSNDSLYNHVLSILRILNRCIPIGKDFTVRVGNYRMHADTLDRIIAIYLWKWGLLEGFETQWMRNAIQRGMCVLDIGANIGYYTLLMADLVGKEGAVYAFEPEPANYSVLVRNVALNGHKNVVVVPKAVVSSNHSVKFYKNKGNRGDNSLYGSLGVNYACIEVEGVSLDSYFPSGKKIDLIKMDIQGGEIEAFGGMERVIHDNPKIKIIFELTPEKYDDPAADSVSLLSALQDRYGLTLLRIDERNRVTCLLSRDDIARIAESRQCCNLIARREN